MSPYQIDWLPNEHVIVGKLHLGYDARRDTQSVSRRLSNVLNTSDKPVPAILDLSDFSAHTRNAALNALAKGSFEALRHPKLIELLIVDNGISMPLDSPTVPARIAGRTTRHFSSMRAALDYARDKYSTLQLSVN